MVNVEVINQINYNGWSIHVTDQHNNTIDSINTHVIEGRLSEEQIDPFFVDDIKKIVSEYIPNINEFSVVVDDHSS